MKVNLTSSKGLESKLSVIVTKKEIQEKIDKKLDEVKDTINLKGFRPGKAPRELLKKQFGKALFIDNEIQVAESDEHLYSSTFVNSGLNLNSNKEKAAIIGGGDGGVARECLSKGFDIIDWYELDPEVVKVRDSITGMAMVLDLLAEEGRPLSALVADLPALAMVKEKRDLSSIGGRAAVPEVLAAVRSTFGDGQVNDLDGVRVDLAEGWVHVRPSNTEPIVRVIAEADTKDQAEALVARVTQAANL